MLVDRQTDRQQRTDRGTGRCKKGKEARCNAIRWESENPWRGVRGDERESSRVESCQGDNENDHGDDSQTIKTNKQTLTHAHTHAKTRIVAMHALFFFFLPPVCGSPTDRVLSRGVCGGECPVPSLLLLFLLLSLFAPRLGFFFPHPSTPHAQSHRAFLPCRPSMHNHELFFLIIVSVVWSVECFL